MFIRKVDELLGDALLEVDWGIKALQPGDCLFKLLESCDVALSPVEMLVLAAQLAAHSLHFLAEPGEQLHVALATFDFLIEDDAIKAFSTFD